VTTAVVPLAEAHALPNVRTLTGEDYPDPVRTVRVCAPSEAGEPRDVISSVEFCGGTHISNTEEASAFTIIGIIFLVHLNHRYYNQLHVSRRRLNRKGHSSNRSRHGRTCHTGSNRWKATSNSCVSARGAVSRGHPSKR
jgi:hypothetical protein